MWAWALKFLSGFAIWKGEKLGKVLWVSVIVIAIGFGFWKLFLEAKIKNTTQTIVQQGGTVTQNYVTNTTCPQEPALVILKLWRLRLFSVR